MTQHFNSKSTPVATYRGHNSLSGAEYKICIDYSRDDLLSEAGVSIMQDRYLLDSERSPQESFARVSCAFADNQAHAQRLYDYVSSCWFMYATPVLANGGTTRGLPISCFLSDFDDSVESIADHYHENFWLAVRGGGIGNNLSKLRSMGTATSNGNYTPGVIPFAKVIDSLTLASIQGATRRGATAIYLSVSHPEIEEFIEIRKPTGDANRRSWNIHNAVSIPDAFMEAVQEGNLWDLVDPHTNEVVKQVDARSLFMKILETRVAFGEPFIFFEDTANNALPEHLKNKGLKINHTNLCTEIMLPTAPDRTAVCCLSSVNLEYFDEWKDNEVFIEDLLRMLDNVLETFIVEAPEYLWRATSSAALERSVGLGAMGYHLYLQNKGIPFEGAVAVSQNIKIFRHIKDYCDKANRKLGMQKGSPKDAEGTGLRFSHTNAIAPNANISILCGSTSPSIEPHRANAFTQKTQSGVFLIKNKILDNLLQTKYGLKDKELEKVWSDITINEGSVQHLDFLEDSDKEVFKTAMELDQRWIIEHAAKRQEFIDQGQSVNLFLPPDINKGELYGLHKDAWQQGLKSLYYCRTKSVGKTDVVSKNIDNGVVNDDKRYEVNECLSCEG